MIYTVTLNPAIDWELTVPEIQFDSVLRASQSRVDFGGKGFNVSRLLGQMGAASTALGFVGGQAGERLRDGLHSLGIATDFVWVPGETRTNISVVTAAHDHYVKVNEVGPAVDAGQQEELVRKIEGLAREGDWWVLAGSPPPGVAADFYARLIEVVVRHGARAVLDCAGEALRLGCTNGPYLVKPNEEEAQELAGMRIGKNATSGMAAGGGKARSMDAELAADVDEGLRKRLYAAAEAAARIRETGARNVVVSMGKDGALLSTGGQNWFAQSPQIEQKNPIGAGDAMVGGIVWALSRGRSLKEALAWGVASGAATASLGGTEMGSQPMIERLFGLVRYEDLS